MHEARMTKRGHVTRLRPWWAGTGILSWFSLATCITVCASFIVHILVIGIYAFTMPYIKLLKRPCALFNYSRGVVSAINLGCLVRPH
jgi:hypothetical protein